MSMTVAMAVMWFMHPLSSYGSAEMRIIIVFIWLAILSLVLMSVLFLLIFILVNLREGLQTWIMMGCVVFSMYSPPTTVMWSILKVIELTMMSSKFSY